MHTYLRGSCTTSVPSSSTTGLCQNWQKQLYWAYWYDGCRMEDLGPMPVKKTYTVLIGGFLKGGNYQEASETLQQMLKRGLRPDPHVMLAVLRSLQKADLVTQYLHLCKTLAQVGLIEPCLLFFYIDALNLCIIRVL